MEDSLNFKKIEKGSILKGRVIHISDDEITVDLNYLCDGIIKKSELVSSEIEKFYEIGKEIVVYVISPDYEGGNVLLSEKKAYYFDVMDELNQIYKSNKVVSVYVKENVNAGLICEFKGIRGFIPKSKVYNNRDNLNFFLEKNLDVILIEISENRIIFSNIDAEEVKSKEIRKKFIDVVNVGDEFSAIVESIKDFGIFINVKGITGFVHKSEMSYKRRFNANDIVKVSDEVSVRLLKVDIDNQKLYFSMKDLKSDPFLNFVKDFKIGEIYEVCIEKIVTSGIIVLLNDEVTGFIHISEFPEDMQDLNRSFIIGDKIKAKILKIDSDNKKISLSYSKVLENNYDNNEYFEEEKFNTFGEIFKDIFLKLK